MKIKKILLISLIAVAMLASVSVVNAGFLDGLFSGSQQQDNVIKIEGITFNTTNATNFTHDNRFDQIENQFNHKVYHNTEKNGKFGKCTIHIIQFYQKDLYQNAMQEYKKANDPVAIIDGIEIYLTSADTGEYVGEPRYEATIYNIDLDKSVRIVTPDANETAKMASSLKFK